ncbi:hypothetical protein [Micromonospora sediminicola]|uniref:hypothetical protein n=1 Tax=Micromonospora sediminicola TaxID=946078 RepID=UPI0037B26A57
MTVIDQAVWDRWYDDDREGPGIAILLADAGPVTALLPVVREVVDRSLLAPPEGVEDPADIDEVVPTPDGVCLGAVDGAELRPRLEPIAAELGRRGVAGTLLPYPVPDAPPPASWWHADVVQCRLAVDPAPERGLREGLTAALSWLAVTDWSTVEVSIGTVPWSRATADLVLDLVPAGLAVSPRHPAQILVADGPRFRLVRFVPETGHLVFATGAADHLGPDVTDVTARIVRALEVGAPWSRYGFARRARGLLDLGGPWHRPEDRPGVLPTAVDERTFEERGVLDVFGAQLVPRSWGLSWPADRWSVRPVGDKDLVVARDPGPWWTSPRPDPQARARGRADVATHLPPD